MSVVVDTGVDTADLLVAVPAAVLGAAGFGMATAAQQRATKEVPPSPTLHPRLVLDLLARPWWLLGLVLTVVALAGQLVALAFGPLAVVQPLLVTGVAFAATFTALLARRRPDRFVVLGALLCAVGLAAFLLLARPEPGPPGGPGVVEAITLAAVLAALTVGALVVAAVIRHPVRILALALATGLLFGVTAALMKVVTDQLRLGIAEPFTHPVLYVACVVGPLGFLLSQNTFQQGRLVSPAVAVITTVDPVVGVFAGVAWLGEDLDAGPLRLAGEIGAAAVVLAGIATVTVRGRHLLEELDAAADGTPP